MPAHPVKDNSRTWNLLMRNIPQWVNALIMARSDWSEIHHQMNKFNHRVGGASGNTNSKSKVKILLGVVLDPHGDFWKFAWLYDIVTIDGREFEPEAYTWDNLELAVWRGENRDVLDHSQNPIPPLILEEMRLAEEARSVRVAMDTTSPLAGFYVRNKQHEKGLKGFIQIMQKKYSAIVKPFGDQVGIFPDGCASLNSSTFLFDVKTSKSTTGFLIAEDSLRGLIQFKPEVVLVLVGSIETEEPKFYACWAKDVPTRLIHYFNRPGTCAKQYHDQLEDLRRRYPKTKIKESQMPKHGKLSGKPMIGVEKSFPIVQLDEFISEFF